MDYDCSWLPNTIPYDCDLDEYIEKLHTIFINDFIDSHPIFLGKDVIPRREPVIDGKYESFRHIITGHSYSTQNRTIDIERCKRINWIKEMISNYDCRCLSNCDNYLIWKKRVKNQTTYNLLLKSERYFIVLQERTKYFLLITAYRIDYDNYFYDKIDEYNKFCIETENAIIR